MKKNLSICLVVFFLVAVAVFGLNLLTTQQQVPSSDWILSLTAPVYSFSGTVESKDNNRLVVSGNVASAAPSANTQAAQSSVKKLTFNILVSERVIITRMLSFVPYSFKASQAPGSALPAQTQLKIADIKVGDVISATASVDLRTLAKPEFEAVSISVDPGINSFSGVITDINDTIIKVKATIGGPGINPLAGQPVQKEFAVRVNSDTEISQPGVSVNPLKPPILKNLSLLDLKKDMQATVYIDGNINASQPFAALLISIPNAPAMSVIPVSAP